MSGIPSSYGSYPEAGVQYDDVAGECVQTPLTPEESVCVDTSVTDAAPVSAAPATDAAGGAPAAHSAPRDVARPAPRRASASPIALGFDDAARGAGVRLARGQHYLPAADASRFMEVFGHVRDADQGSRRMLDVRTMQRDLGIGVDGQVGGSTVSAVAARFLTGAINLPMGLDADDAMQIIAAAELLIDGADPQALAQVQVGTPPHPATKEDLKAMVIQQLGNRLGYLPAEQQATFIGRLATLNGTQQGLTNQQALATEAYAQTVAAMTPERLGALSRQAGVMTSPAGAAITARVAAMNLTDLEAFARTAKAAVDQGFDTIPAPVQTAIVDRETALATEAGRPNGGNRDQIHAVVEAAKRIHGTPSLPSLLGGPHDRLGQAIKTAWEHHPSAPATPAAPAAPAQPARPQPPMSSGEAVHAAERVISLVEASGDMGDAQENQVVDILGALPAEQRVAAIGELNNSQWAQLVREMDGDELVRMVADLQRAPATAFSPAAAARVAWAVHNKLGSQADLVQSANRTLLDVMRHASSVGIETVMDWAMGHEVGEGSNARQLDGSRGLARTIAQNADMLRAAHRADPSLNLAAKLRPALGRDEMVGMMKDLVRLVTVSSGAEQRQWLDQIRMARLAFREPMHDSDLNEIRGYVQHVLDHPSEHRNVTMTPALEDTLRALRADLEAEREHN